jgi:hypothetical protein
LIGRRLLVLYLSSDLPVAFILFVVISPITVWGFND